MKKYQILKNFPEYSIKENHDETSFINSLMRENTNHVPGTSGNDNEEQEKDEDHDSIFTISKNDMKLHGDESGQDKDDINEDVIRTRYQCDRSQTDVRQELQNMRRQLEEDMRKVLNEKLSSNIEDIKNEFKSTMTANNEELKSIIQFYTEHNTQNKDK